MVPDPKRLIKLVFRRCRATGVGRQAASPFSRPTQRGWFEIGEPVSHTLELPPLAVVATSNVERLLQASGQLTERSEHKQVASICAQELQSRSEGRVVMHTKATQIELARFAADCSIAKSRCACVGLSAISALHALRPANVALQVDIRRIERDVAERGPVIVDAYFYPIRRANRCHSVQAVVASM
jgi:hypothetical protein